MSSTNFSYISSPNSYFIYDTMCRFRKKCHYDRVQTPVTWLSLNQSTESTVKPDLCRIFRFKTLSLFCHCLFCLDNLHVEKYCFVTVML